MKKSDQRWRATECSVLLLCPHALIREGLGSLIARDEDLRLAGLAADVDSALKILERKKPDALVIASITGPQGRPPDIGILKSSHPDLPILVISPNLDHETVQSALAAGATGYLPMDASQDELARGIYALRRGEIFLDSSVAVNLLSHLADSSSGQDARLREEDFSHREREVLACLVRGMSDRDIAQRLFLSVRTVQSHLAHIYGKMGVHSRTEAALMAARADWLSRAG
jgi:two-component system NarL family response regulator/two-component system response regulator DevR